MPPPTEPRAKILIVDDEEVILDVTSALLTRRGGYEVRLASDAEEALAVLAAHPIDLVLLDLFLPGVQGLGLLRRIKSDDPTREVIMMTAHGSVESAVEALKVGAFHYLAKPFQNDEVILLVETALTQRRLKLENAGLRRALAGAHRSGRLIGKSPAMLAVFRLIEQLAPARTTVLITGESGTGKELTAEAIHQLGPRSAEPFVVVNSSNLPSDLLESHLFGHARGAFTGAVSDHVGLFESAAGGTLFFDEISTISLDVQAKLLRALQEKEFLPLGSVRPVKVDVRILAATNEDLARLVKVGAFREDLFYRLNVVTVPLPPLRARREDIPLLLEHFLGEFGEEHARLGLRFAPEALHALVQYDWPGNVRQLAKTVERALLLATGETDEPSALPEEIRGHGVHTDAGPSLRPGQAFEDAVEDFERRLIRAALRESRGVQRRAATLLKMKPTTLNERMKRLGIRAGEPTPD